MFEELRYNGGFKAVSAAVVLFALAAYLAFVSSGGLSTGQSFQGVVITEGSVVVAKVCGATQEVASVRLSKGGVVQALVASGGPLQPGAPVTVRQESFSCNPTHYEIVSHK